MYFIRYEKEIKGCQALICFGIVTALELIPISYTPHVTLVYSIIAYFLFIVLQYLGKKINWSLFKRVISCFSKYSYAIFLVHHPILNIYGDYFTDATLDKYGIMCIYGICWITIFIMAKLIYNVHKSIISFLKTN